jgi:hypothetical protein
MPLSGWDSNQQFRLTIDSSKVDGDLENFPVNITLSSGTGISNYDTTDVFDALTTDVVSGTSFFYKTDFDLSGQEHTFDIQGNPKLYANTTPSGMLGSMYFDGAGDYLTSSSSPDWNFGTDDFTIDYWIYLYDYVRPASFDPHFYFDSNNYIRHRDNGKINIIFGGSSQDEAGTSMAYNNTWFHVAIVRSSGTVKVYLNGSDLGISFSPGSLDLSSLGLSIGGFSTYQMHGLISEFRISKGIARWTSNFTPPTEPYTTDEYTKLLLHFEGDKSDNQHILEHVGTRLQSNAGPFTGKQSTYFHNPASEYISISDSDAFAFGTGDFTIALWVNFTDISATRALLGQGTDGNNRVHLFWSNPSTQLYFSSEISGVTAVATSVSWTPTLGQWYHIALVRSSGTYYYFIDGEDYSDVSASNSIDQSGNLTIGASLNSSGVLSFHMYGYMSDILIVKGTALWTSEFAVAKGMPLNSWYNRHKIAITDSNDNKLNTEIAYWDDFNKTASLWTAVPTIASGTDTTLTLYYDATASGSDTRTPAEAGDDFTGTDGDAPDITKWGISNGTPNIQGDSVRCTFHGTDDDDKILSLYKISGDFDIQVDFSLSSAPSVNGWGSALLVWAAPGDYAFVYRGYAGSHNYYKEVTVSSSVVQNLSTSTSDTSGKFRAVRTGSNIYGYYWNGSGWTEIGSVYGSCWTDDVYVGLQNFEWTGNPSGFYCDFDNFTVNSADSITGFVGDTGTAPAQAVWDSNYKRVWHLRNSSLVDSTANDVTASLGTGSFTDSSNDLLGNALYSNGSYSAATFSLSSISSLSNRTLEFLMMPTAQGTGSWANVMFSQSSTELLNYRYHGNDSSKLIDYRFGSSSNTVELNELAHVAVNNTHGYLNGDIERTGTAPSISTSSALRISGRETRTTYTYKGFIAEIRVSDVARSDAWVKASYYTNFDDLITYGAGNYLLFNFYNASPIDSIKVYGTTHQLAISATLSGNFAPEYFWDAEFYDGQGAQIGSTVSGVTNSGTATVTYPTPSGTDYDWYCVATSSGFDATSDTYTFINRFLCEGSVTIDEIPASGVPVRLYLRSTGELVGEDVTSTVSGTFAIETDQNAYHYAIAMRDTSNRNAQIADWLIP